MHDGNMGRVGVSSDAALEQVLGTRVLETARPICAGMAIICSVFVGFNLMGLTASRETFFSIVLSDTMLATCFGVAWWLLKSKKIRPEWGNPLISTLSLLTLADVLLIVALMSPFFSAYVAILFIGLGCLFLSVRWIFFTNATSLSAWLFVAAWALPKEDLMILGFPILAAFALSFLIHHARLKNHLRVEELRRLDEKFREELSGVLRHTEVRYRQIVETAYEGICLTGLDGKLTYVNPRLTTMLGYSVEDLIGLSFLDLIHEEDREQVKTQSDRRRILGAEQYECRFIHSDGSHVWCLVSESPVFGIDNEFAGVLALLSDVSQRRISEDRTRARLKVEHFLGQISRRFVNPGDFDEEISQTLAQVGKLLSASRVYLFMTRDHGQNLKNTHEWCGEGSTPRIQSLQAVRVRNLRWWMNELDARHTIVVEDSELLNDEAIREKHALGHTRWNSIIVCPIYAAEELIGFLGLDNPSTPHIELRFAVSIVEGVARTLMSAIFRRRAETRYQRLFERNLAGVFRSTLDGRLLDCNESFYRMFGFASLEEARNTPTGEMYPSRDDRERFLRRLLENGRLSNFEWRGLRRDGTFGWFLEVCSIVPDESGTLSVIEGTTFDITARKKAEQARTRIADRLQALHEIGRAIMAADSPLAIAEKALSRLTGLVPSDYACVVLCDMPEDCSPSEMRVLSLEDDAITQHSFPKQEFDDCKTCSVSESIYISDTKIAALECRVAAALGIEDVRSVACEPMEYQEKQLGALLIFSQKPNAFDEEHAEIAVELADLLSVAMHEARLRHQAEMERGRFESIVEHLPEAVLVLDESRHIQFCNPAAEKHLPLLTQSRMGDALDSIAGKPLDDLFLAASDGGWHLLTVETDQRAETRQFEAVARNLVKRANQKGSIVVLRDVTHEREVQRRVQGQQRLAAVGQLAAGIAHDFNNVLQSIMMAGELLMDDPDVPAEQNDAVETVVEQTKRGANLVRQILDFSRKSVRTREALDLAEVLNDMMSLLKRTIREDIRVKFEIAAATEDHIVLADPTQIQQAVTNLMINAQDAIGGQGELRISLAVTEFDESERPRLPGMTSGPWVEVRVSDNGSGIPAELRQHIFEPFFTTKPPGKGTGLGLAQVYGIVKQNEGFIDFVSHVGEGTTFKMFFPQISGINTQEEVSVESPLPRGQGELILVVEDAAPLLRVVSHALSSYGYRVVAADRVNEAVAICRRLGNDVDLVVSDVVMPEKSGPELLAHIRPLCPKAKFILMSGYGRDSDNSDLPSEAIADWLQKPFSMNVLVERVARVLSP